MKYFDKNTMISQNKHLDKDVRNPWDPIGDREQRRLDKKNYKKFLTKFSGNIKKDWWECLSPEDQKSIYKEYEHILRMCKYNRNVPDFKKWISMVKEDYKPNVQLYRERMIDNVLK
jgi:hypothetical protein